MGLFQKMNEQIKRGIRSWLNIVPSNPYSIQIQEVLDFETNAIRNRIWYRGDGNELEQMYQQNPEWADRYKFWACKSTPGMEMRKIHTGLPGLIVRILAAIVLTDMNPFDFSENEAQKTIWEAIAKENKFTKKLEKTLKEVLFIGDGAFKVTIDTEVSSYPILEWYPGDRIEIIRHRDRVKEVIFKTPYKSGYQQYVLFEHYGFGYIKNELYLNEMQVGMDVLEETKGIRDFTFDQSVMLAVPVQVYESAKFEGRGGSVFDGKLDSFDALDEAWSQWMDALRAGRAKTYIPECLVPRNPNTGEILRPNSFDNRFIQSDNDMSEGAKNQIDTEQPTIPHESYLASYCTALDLCLQGLISPSTLGIDVKMLDNAEAQREKEKATLYTRDAIIEAMQEALPELVSAAINAYYLLLKQPVQEIKVAVPFGEYANPSFESQVETLTKARPGAPLLSIEAQVEELYGDSKDEEWKKKEIERLKAEQGMLEMEEPAVGQELDANKENALEGSSMLNGAQISSLMNVIKMVKEKSVTRSEAIAIITATLGISRENAESFIEEGMQSAGEGSQPSVPNG